MVLVKSTSSPKGQSLARSTLGFLPALELCECPFMMFGIADRTSSVLSDWVMSQCSTWWAVLPSVRRLASLE